MVLHDIGSLIVLLLVAYGRIHAIQQALRAKKEPKEPEKNCREGEEQKEEEQKEPEGKAS